MVTGRTVLGKHHLTILAMGRTIRDMERCVQDATKELQNFGITTVREDMNAEPCFWAQLPGNFSYVARAAMISSRNFVGFASLHNFAVGRKEGNRWGPAISLLQTTSQTPYYFNFHRRQVGNFTVVGPTGSGKTVALSFLMSQALRVTPSPRCAFFDKDRGAEVFIRALGGRYEALAPGSRRGSTRCNSPAPPKTAISCKTCCAFSSGRATARISAPNRKRSSRARSSRYSDPPSRAPLRRCRASPARARARRSRRSRVEIFRLAQRAGLAVQQ